MTFLNDLIGSIAYSIIGFVIGWLGGYEARALDTIRKNVKAGYPNVDSGEREDMSKRVRLNSLGVVGYVVVILSLVTVLQSTFVIVSQRKQTACLAEYNDTFAEVTSLRAEWADREREAMVRFLNTFRTDTYPSETERRQALLNLLKAYEEVSELRQDTPLPTLEECD